MKTRKILTMILAAAGGSLLLQSNCVQLGSMGLAALTSALSSNQTLTGGQNNPYAQQGYYPTGQSGYYPQQSGYYPYGQGQQGYPYYPSNNYPYYPNYPQNGQGTPYPYYPTSTGQLP